MSKYSLQKLLISESSQTGTVYHFTTVPRLKKILKSDKLRASSSEEIGKRVGNFTGPYGTSPYGSSVSTTRLWNAFEKGHVLHQEPEIGLILSGNRLSNKYKSKPQDEMAWVDDTGKVRGWNDDSSTRRSEHETVWYGSALERNNGIPNIKTYITGLLLTSVLLNSEDAVPKTLDLIGWLKQNYPNIPIYIAPTVNKHIRDMLMRSFPELKTYRPR